MTMKTAVSIPDDVYEAGEALAERLGLSRSAIYTRALRALLVDLHEADVTASYNEAFGDDGDVERAEDRALVAQSRRIFREVEWNG